MPRVDGCKKGWHESGKVCWTYSKRDYTSETYDLWIVAVFEWNHLKTDVDFAPVEKGLQPVWIKLDYRWVTGQISKRLPARHVGPKPREDGFRFHWRDKGHCAMLAAAATTAAYRKFTTLAVRHRKLFCAWNAIFAARWVLPACAAAAVHSDVSNSRHVAKHRVNSAAVWRDPLCHQMMKCLAWSTCASWTASPESAAAWGLAIWSARRCRGARNLPLTRFSTSKSNFCMQIFSSL